MIDTKEVRKLLLKASRKPNSKNLDALVCCVSELCDEYEKRPTVLEIINENQKSIENTFEFIKSLRG